MQSFKLVPKITSSGYIVGHCTKIMAAVFLTKKKSRYTCVKRLRLATNLPRPKKVAIYLHKTYSVQKKSLGILSKKLQRLKKGRDILEKKTLCVQKDGCILDKNLPKTKRPRETCQTYRVQTKAVVYFTKRTASKKNLLAKNLLRLINGRSKLLFTVIVYLIDLPEFL